MISNSYLIRQSFKEYGCDLGIAIFAWRVTCNYVYCPFKGTRFKSWFVVKWVLVILVLQVSSSSPYLYQEKRLKIPIQSGVSKVSNNKGTRSVFKFYLIILQYERKETNFSIPISLQPNVVAWTLICISICVLYSVHELYFYMCIV